MLQELGCRKVDTAVLQSFPLLAQSSSLVKTQVASHSILVTNKLYFFTLTLLVSKYFSEISNQSMQIHSIPIKIYYLPGVLYICVRWKQFISRSSWVISPLLCLFKISLFYLGFLEQRREGTEHVRRYQVAGGVWTFADESMFWASELVIVVLCSTRESQE